MPRVLSQDLRERVVAAVDSGMSCRQAAVRFGVSAASAIRWRQLVLQHGTPAAKPQGGDRRAGRIDAHAAFILGSIEAKDDITLVELQALLADRGTPVGIGTLWRFFDRHRITRKKTRPAKLAGRFVVRVPPSRRLGRGGTGCARSVRAGAGRGDGAVCSMPAGRRGPAHARWAGVCGWQWRRSAAPRRAARQPARPPCALLHAARGSAGIRTAAQGRCWCAAGPARRSSGTVRDGSCG